VQLPEYLTQNMPMITMGVGAGSVCDTQYLFSSDVLGANTGHYPRHAKKYTNIAAMMAEIQWARVKAFSAFAHEVATGVFPGPGHEIRMSDDAFEKFLAEAGLG